MPNELKPCPFCGSAGNCKESIGAKVNEKQQNTE